MPAGPDVEMAARLAKQLVDLHASAEADLVEAVARRVARGITLDGWAERKLAEIGQLRREAEARLARLLTDVEQALPDVIGRAHTAGVDQATRDLAHVGIDVGFGHTNTAAVDAIARQAVGQLAGTHMNILRTTLDAYRAATVDAAQTVTAGTATRRQAAQRVLDRLADQGIGGFIDTAGRTWQLDTYAEMTTRTAAGRAQVQGALDRYQAAGKDLVIVSDAPQECPACRPWEGRVLSISGATTGDVGGGMTVAGTVSEAVGAGLQHANCFPGDVLVSGPPVDAADARWYEGDLVIIHTAGGDELPVTPNHPVLTAEGWVTAGALHVGDQLVRHLGAERMGLVGPDEDRVPTPISQVAGALRQAGPVVAVSVPAAAEQFHGDGFGGQVDVVLADRLLSDGLDASAEHPCGHAPFVAGGMGLVPLLAERPSLQVLVRAGQASHGVMSAGDLCGSGFWGHARPLPPFSLRAAALHPGLDHPVADRRLGDAEIGGNLVLGLSGLVPVDDLGGVRRRGSVGGADSAPFLHAPNDAGFPDHPIDGAAADADTGRDLLARLAAHVALDDVVRVERREFRGHVYNLQTRGGWYTANGIVVHNCRHRLGLYIPGLTRPMHGTADPEGDAARQEQRYLERGVRRWKRRELASLDEDAARRARAKVAEWQGRLRGHVDGHDLKRLPQRERIGVAH